MGYPRVGRGDRRHRAEVTDSGGGAALLAALGVRRAVIVSSPSLVGSEIVADAIRGFESSGVTLTEKTVRPISRDVDGVLSLGGGSTIRAAREFAASLPAGRHAAVPTTTSCVEQFDDPGAPRPDAVFFDVRGIRSVPRPLRSAQAFNAMTYAFAAVCENEVSPADVGLAREAVGGLRRGLLRAAEGDDLDDTTALAMLHAAARAGAAARSAQNSIARSIGEALHARAEISYALCVALVLPFALAYLRRARADRIALFAPLFEHAEIENNVEAADAVIAAVRKLGQNAGIPRNFRSAGISRDAMESAAKSVPQLPAAKNFVLPFESAEQLMNEVFRFAW